MNIADNVLYHHLRNVYFVGGTACAGKTTMSKLIAERHGFRLYDADNTVAEHKPLCSRAEQPAMLRPFTTFEDYFNCPVAAYSKWLLDSMEEQMDFILMDLVRLADQGPVVADVHCFPDILRRVAAPERIVLLIAEPALVRAQYFDRQDKRDMYDCIMNTTKEPVATLKNVLDTVEATTGVEFVRALESGLRCIVRDESSTIEGTYVMMADHFGLL